MQAVFFKPKTSHLKEALNAVYATRNEATPLLRVLIEKTFAVPAKKRFGRLSWKCMVGLLRHWAWLFTVAVAEGGGLEPPHENYPMTD